MNFHVSKPTSTGDCKKAGFAKCNTCKHVGPKTHLSKGPPPFLQVPTLKLMKNQTNGHNCVSVQYQHQGAAWGSKMYAHRLSPRNNLLWGLRRAMNPKKKGESFLWGCLVPKSPGSKPPIYPVNEETQGKKNVRVVGWGTWWCPSGCTRNKFGSCNFTDKAKDSGNACIAQVSQYFVIHPTTST